MVEPTGARTRGRLRDIPADSLCTVRVNGEVLGSEPLSALNAGEGFPSGPVGTFSWLAEQLQAPEVRASPHHTPRFHA